MTTDTIGSHPSPNLHSWTCVRPGHGDCRALLRPGYIRRECASGRKNASRHCELHELVTVTDSVINLCGSSPQGLWGCDKFIGLDCKRLSPPLPLEASASTAERGRRQRSSAFGLCLLLAAAVECIRAWLRRHGRAVALAAAAAARRPRCPRFDHLLPTQFSRRVGRAPDTAEEGPAARLRSSRAAAQQPGRDGDVVLGHRDGRAAAGALL